MKRTFAALSLMLGTMYGAQAFEPIVEITSPADGTVQYVPAFPVTVPVEVSFALYNPNNNNCINNAVSLLTVTASQDDGSPAVIYSQNPNLGNICPSFVSFDWSVTEPGSYTLELTARHGGDTGSDTIVVEYLLQLVSVEYIAPPAIANAYINANPTLKKLQAKRRGCIISKIATMHGQDEAFGPKPGPYNEPLIRSTVDSLLGC